MTYQSDSDVAGTFKGAISNRILHDAATSDYHSLTMFPLESEANRQNCPELKVQTDVRIPPPAFEEQAALALKALESQRAILERAVVLTNRMEQLVAALEVQITRLNVRLTAAQRWKSFSTRARAMFNQW